ncbi:hypothetical protein C8R44DRAFT_741026 [Mycena epipterygia]|nr:hypothetical protein C8R44DRAFT_741026 [Mycena epipterygia]
MVSNAAGRERLSAIWTPLIVWERPIFASYLRPNLAGHCHFVPEHRGRGSQSTLGANGNVIEYSTGTEVNPSDWSVVYAQSAEHATRERRVSFNAGQHRPPGSIERACSVEHVKQGWGTESNAQRGATYAEVKIKERATKVEWVEVGIADWGIECGKDAEARRERREHADGRDEAGWDGERSAGRGLSDKEKEREGQMGAMKDGGAREVHSGEKWGESSRGSGRTSWVERRCAGMRRDEMHRGARAAGTRIDEKRGETKCAGEGNEVCGGYKVWKGGCGERRKGGVVYAEELPEAREGGRGEAEDGEEERGQRREVKGTECAKERRQRRELERERSSCGAVVHIRTHGGYAGGGGESGGGDDGSTRTEIEVK